jgi:hypothetical protein
VLPFGPAVGEGMVFGKIFTAESISKTKFHEKGRTQKRQEIHWQDAKRISHSDTVFDGE